MKRQKSDNTFQTHIAEPRWQQIASIVVVLGLIGLWIWAAFIRHRQ